MKTKLIAISLIAIGVCITACRQSDDNLLEDDIQSSAQSSNQTESQKTSKDSLSTDPPRDGSHWKTTDSIQTNPPRNFTMKLDSLKSTIIDNNGPKDPPRDGSHWKTK